MYKLKEVRTRKAKASLAIVILVAAAIWFISLLIGPSTVTIPSDLHSPSLATSTPLPKVHTTPVPSQAPETQQTLIYVIANHIPSYWGIDSVIVGWNKATNTDFVRSVKCPSFKPCVYIEVNKKLPEDTAAQTEFGYRNDIVIELNPIVTKRQEAQSTLCHEMGHTLGLPHISGTANTCMTANDDFYRVTPSALDLRLANSYGKWSLEKMYVLSGKDLDVRSIPR